MKIFGNKYKSAIGSMSLVYASVVVIVASSAFVLSVARWNFVEITELEVLAREYHLATMGAADRIEHEIFVLQSSDQKNHSLTGRTNDDGGRHGRDTREFTMAAFVTSLHVIEAEFKDLRERQARYRGADYERTLARAMWHFERISVEGRSPRPVGRHDTEKPRVLHKGIGAFLMTIRQLRKLHAITYGGVVDTIAMRRQENTRRFVIMLVATIGLSSLLVFYLLRRIYVGFVRQMRTEQALRDSESALQERVAELEETQCKLEQQGQELAHFSEELRISHDSAQIANRSKSEFLAMMSHELRTPLNAIIGFSDVIKNEVFGPVGNVRYHSYGKHINDSGQHLLALVNDILDLSKIESGRDELHEKRVEIPNVIMSILVLLRMRAIDSGLELELDIVEDLPLLRADERKLKQILSNLITNAIKFTDPGGKVTVRSWCGLENVLVIEIADTGIGIASDDIPKALSKFTQVQGEAARQHAGTGLGLPLTKALVEQHGGVLDVQSEVGVGTTVTVRFPAERTIRLRQGAQPLGVSNRALI